jgi:hypothetical protein
MNRSRCERETEVVGAMRSGAVSAELDLHMEGCTACAKTRKVTALMLLHAAAIQAQNPQPPMASRVWRRAQAQQQADALKRATLALALMRSLGAVYLVVLIVWSLRALWRSQGVAMMPAWSSLASGTVFLGAGVAVVLIALGAWWLLLLGKRAGSTATST